MIKSDFLRFLSYIFVIIIVFSVQSAYGFLPTINGYHIDILVPIVVTITVLDELEIAVFCAGFLSFVYDFNYQIPQGLSFIFFVIAVISIHFIVNHYYTKNIITQIMFTTVVILAFRLMIYVFIRSNFLFYFQITTAEVLISVIFSPIAYLIVRTLKGRVLE